MKRAILTGFEPFGNYKWNPVQDTTREYDGKSVGDIEVVGLVLPSTYYGGFELLSKKIDELGPDLILGTGLSSNVKKIRFEAIGRNIMNGKYPDANGLKPKDIPILPHEEDFYRASVHNDSLVRHLSENGVPAEKSFDAEGFICNSLIYLTARRIDREKLPIKFGFFHTRWTDDYLDRINLEEGKTTISKDELRKAIDLTLVGMDHY